MKTLKYYRWLIIVLIFNSYSHNCYSQSDKSLSWKEFSPFLSELSLGAWDIWVKHPRVTKDDYETKEEFQNRKLNNSKILSSKFEDYYAKYPSKLIVQSIPKKIEYNAEKEKVELYLESIAGTKLDQPSTFKFDVQRTLAKDNDILRNFGNLELEYKLTNEITKTGYYSPCIILQSLKWVIGNTTFTWNKKQ